MRVAFVLTTRRQRGDGRAVIIAVTVQDFVLLAAIAFVRDLADHLEALLVRFGPGVAIVDAGHARHLVNQHFGKVGAGDGTGGPGKVVQLYQLVAHGIGDALTAIADVNGPDAAGHGIEVFLALLVPDAHALAFDNDARIGCFIGLMLAQVMPDVRAVCFDNAGEVVFVEIAVHGVRPFVSL